MAKKVTTTKRKTPPALKSVIAEKVMPAGHIDTKGWLTLAGLIAGGISFIGFILFSNLTITLSENVQIISIFILSVLAIAGVVLSILAILPGKAGGATHGWLGLNIIGFVVSFLMLDKFISPLISVVSYLFSK